MTCVYQARFIYCDLTSDADIAALVKATVETTGRLDYLVNLACTYLDNSADTELGGGYPVGSSRKPGLQRAPRWRRVNHSVIIARLAFTASIVGFNTTETPGSESTLSSNWFSVGINVLTNPAAILR
jgi:NAD(P)-dependent dehydrogenase (short-subunit alcohol dehydrogenase family)